ncbi:MAG TPA: feruloyl-CoA synthase [Thermoanaerobaculia bacterium]|nr:feruloyl-CoA synthase [Thermoanaerobaculia bacterium]
MAGEPWKPLRLAPVDLAAYPLPGGGLLLRSRQELAPFFRCLGEPLHRWAREAPDRTFLAERTAGDDWRRVSYGEALAAVESLASALLDRGLGADRPVVLLSDNGIDHALLQLGAMHVGIPAVPISPAYSLLSQDHAQLRYLLELTHPGLVYAADGNRFAPALGTIAPETEVVVSAQLPAARPATLFAALLQPPTQAQRGAVAERFSAVGPETVAKILFTSGSTGRPKGVLNTQRMLCSNQQAIAQGWPFLEERPPVVVDWLPWSHTFGGNHNFNLILRNGGTLYIDAGKPAPGLFEKTLKNLSEVPATLHFNVPRGFDRLIPCLEEDPDLRATFFSDLDAIFYAAAALPPHLWARLERLSVAATGRRVPLLSAWGSTETSPCATQVHFPIERAGVIGLPVPGTEIKLAPVSGKLELRVKGPNVTPGYWRRPELLAETFDEEGFLRMGDAGRLADPAEPAAGIVFDGRLGENFKLTSGSWVHVGELRTELVSAAAPIVADLVVTGHDRESVGLLVFADPAGCRSLCPDAAPDTPLPRLVERSEVREALRSALLTHNSANPGSSRRITRALLLSEPPSIDAGEITDKGYLNQRAVRERRAALVERLYSAADDPAILRLD